jgi:flagellum-specific peptidoglycan hydrolase FlgJ
MTQIGSFFSTFIPDFSVVKRSFTTVSERISKLLGFQQEPPFTSTLKSPDQLFLSTKDSNKINNNFSFLDLDNSSINNGISKLKSITPLELKKLGQNDKMGFFKALLPAALESERRYGVPASVTLAQAALESGWGRYSIGGYNIFGIKGSGNAGSATVKTREFINGRYVTITDKFAKYSNFYDAVMSHGKVYQANYKGYQKGLEKYKKNKNPYEFIDTVAKTYATSPTYAKKIKSIMNEYNLVNLTNNSSMMA